MHEKKQASKKVMSKHRATRRILHTHDVREIHFGPKSERLKRHFHASNILSDK